MTPDPGPASCGDDLCVQAAARIRELDEVVELLHAALRMEDAEASRLGYVSATHALAALSVIQRAANTTDPAAIVALIEAGKADSNKPIVSPPWPIEHLGPTDA